MKNLSKHALCIFFTAFAFKGRGEISAQVPNISNDQGRFKAPLIHTQEFLKIYNEAMASFATTRAENAKELQQAKDSLTIEDQTELKEEIGFLETQYLQALEDIYDEKFFACRKNQEQILQRISEKIKIKNNKLQKEQFSLVDDVNQLNQAIDEEKIVNVARDPLYKANQTFQESFDHFKEKPYVMLRFSAIGFYLEYVHCTKEFVDAYHAQIAAYLKSVKDDVVFGKSVTCDARDKMYLKFEKIQAQCVKDANKS